MAIYDAFADFYAHGHYLAVSERCAEDLGPVLAAYDADPKTILDLACGQGKFAALMAARGYCVTGVDRSPRRLDVLRKVILSHHRHMR